MKRSEKDELYAIGKQLRDAMSLDADLQSSDAKLIYELASEAVQSVAKTLMKVGE